MAGVSGGGQRRRESRSVLAGGWLWATLPVGLLVLIAALWYLIIAPGGKAPPLVTATPVATFTPWPTVTPMVVTAPTQTSQPAPQATPKPGAIAIGMRVEVTGTGVNKMRLRQGPGTNTVTIKLVSDGTRFVVVDGPKDADGHTWWKLDDQSGLVGWGAAEYLKPAP